MAARKSAHEEGVRNVKAVFVKEPVFVGSRRTFRYVRQPFNLVEYEWGNGERTTGLELDLGSYLHSRGLTSNGAALSSDDGNNGREIYQDILIFDGYTDLNNWPKIGR
jgi:hypothetical protein